MNVGNLGKIINSKQIRGRQQSAKTTGTKKIQISPQKKCVVSDGLKTDSWANPKTAKETKGRHSDSYQIGWLTSKRSQIKLVGLKCVFIHHRMAERSRNTATKKEKKKNGWWDGLGRGEQLIKSCLTMLSIFDDVW